MGGLIASFVLLPGLLAEGIWAQSTPVTPSSQPWSASRPASVERAIIIPIRDEITDITLKSIERRLAYVRQEDFELVIFELDTPGGALAPTLEICDKIKELRDTGVHCYAWVNKAAYSAGTIIALATDGIFMAANATIGDCQPIMITGMGASSIPKDIEAKATSPLLAELRDSARRNGYNMDMVLALIRPEMQIFWVVNTETGEKRLVTTSDRDRLLGITEESGGLLDYLGKKGSRDKNEDRHEPLSDADSKTWKYVKETPELGKIDQPIVSDRVLLTMRTAEAHAYGFSIATLRNDKEINEYFGISGAVERMENTWLETAVEWLASPMVRGVLFLLMLLGAYTEFQTPGFGFAGAVALVALVLFLGAPYLAGYTVTWEIVAIIGGIALLAIEAFVIPGFGIAGITGLVLLAVGLLASFMPQEPGFGHWPQWPALPGTFDYLERGIYSLAGGMTGAIIGMFLLAKYLPKMPVASRIIIPNPTPEQVRMDDPYGGAARIGDIGRTESKLRPAGKARFGTLLVDVVTEGDFIRPGTRIEVIERRGNRVVVRRLD